MKPIIISTKSFEDTKDRLLIGGSKIEWFHANGFKMEAQYNELVYITFDDLNNLTLICGMEEYKRLDELFRIPPINLKDVLTELVWKLLFENMTKEVLYNLLINTSDKGFKDGVKASQMKMREALGFETPK